MTNDITLFVRESDGRIWSQKQVDDDTFGLCGVAEPVPHFGEIPDDAVRDDELASDWMPCTEGCSVTEAYVLDLRASGN